eukprot:Rhum_TRINITY_DN13480_c1_g1::Rhum_TRINITY_DN13480_c1_g1_i1::g.60442::m.60442
MRDRVPQLEGFAGLQVVGCLLVRWNVSCSWEGGGCDTRGEGGNKRQGERGRGKGDSASGHRGMRAERPAFRSHPPSHRVGPRLRLRLVVALPLRRSGPAGGRVEFFLVTHLLRLLLLLLLALLHLLILFAVHVDVVPVHILPVQDLKRLDPGEELRTVVSGALRGRLLRHGVALVVQQHQVPARREGLQGGEGREAVARHDELLEVGVALREVVREVGQLVVRYVQLGQLAEGRQGGKGGEAHAGDGRAADAQRFKVDERGEDREVGDGVGGLQSRDLLRLLVVTSELVLEVLLRLAVPVRRVRLQLAARRPLHNPQRHVGPELLLRGAERRPLVEARRHPDRRRARLLRTRRVVRRGRGEPRRVRRELRARRLEGSRVRDPRGHRLHALRREEERLGVLPRQLLQALRHRLLHLLRAALHARHERRVVEDVASAHRRRDGQLADGAGLRVEQLVHRGADGVGVEAVLPAPDEDDLLPPVAVRLRPRTPLLDLRDRGPHVRQVVLPALRDAVSESLEVGLLGDAPARLRHEVQRPAAAGDGPQQALVHVSLRVHPPLRADHALERQLAVEQGEQAVVAERPRVLPVLHPRERGDAVLLRLRDVDGILLLDPRLGPLVLRLVPLVRVDDGVPRDVALRRGQLRRGRVERLHDLLRQLLLRLRCEVHLVHDHGGRARHLVRQEGRHAPRVRGLLPLAHLGHRRALAEEASERGHVDHRHHCVEAGGVRQLLARLLADAGVERLRDRHRLTDAGALDDGVVKGALAGQVEQALHKVAAEGAADAAVLQLDHLLRLPHHLLAVDVHDAQVVHHDGDVPAVLLRQQVVQERGLPGTKEPAKHRHPELPALERDAQLTGHAEHLLCLRLALRHRAVDRLDLALQEATRTGAVRLRLRGDLLQLQLRRQRDADGARAVVQHHDAVRGVRVLAVGVAVHGSERREGGKQQ